MGGQLVSDLAALALMDDDSRTSLKGRPSAKESGCLVRADPVG